MEQQSLAAAEEITDRTEGEGPQTIKHTDVRKLERLVLRVQERVLAQTGRDLPREVALEHIIAFRPEPAHSLEDAG